MTNLKENGCRNKNNTEKESTYVSEIFNRNLLIKKEQGKYNNEILISEPGATSYMVFFSKT